MNKTELLFKSSSSWSPHLIGSAAISAKTASSKRNTDPTLFSSYRDRNTPPYSTLNAFASKAVLAVSGYKPWADKFACVKVRDDLCIGEYKHDDGNVDIVSIAENGDVEACRVNAAGGLQQFPPIGPASSTDTTPFLATLIAMYTNKGASMELLDEVTELSKLASAGVAEDDDEVIKQLYRVSDTLYYAAKNALDPMPVNIPSSGCVRQIPNLSKVQLSGTVICGKPDLISASGTNAKKKTRKKRTFTLKDAVERFADFRKDVTDARFSDEEKQWIPDLPLDLVIPPEAIRFADMYVMSRGSARPMVNFLWRGITSYGKSTGVEAIAQMLGIPLMKVTCRSTMETQDFLANFVPDNGNEGTGGVDISFEEIAYDPEGAWLKMTGEEKPAVTDAECFAKAMELAAKSSSTPRYKLVVSDYVKALQNGYIVEIQEPSRIRDAGVLVGLNEFDKQNAVIPLVDGSYCKRHPDAMVFYTDNVGYESCRPIDPSVIRRCDYVKDSYKLDKKAVLKRVERTCDGFEDEMLLDKLYDVWERTATYCKDRDITGGSISATELERWAQAVKYDGYEGIKESYRDLIVSKATSDTDEQEEIMASVGNLML